MNDDDLKPHSNPEESAASTTAPDDGLSFGQWLLQQRQNRSITLEEIASVTKIQLGMLKNIEADDYSKLPAPAFIRGFIVNFARFMGLDEKEAVLRFRTQLKKSDSVNSLSAYLGQNTSTTAASVATASTSDIPRREMTPSGFEKNYNRPSAAMDMDATPFFTPKRLLIAGGVLVAIIVMAILFSIGSKQESSEAENAANSAESSPELSAETPPSDPALAETPPPAAATSAVATTPAAAITPSSVTPEKAPETKTENKTTAEEASFAHHLKVRGIDASWINVRVDQKNSQGMMLEKGQSKDFYGNQKIVLALSDAGGVEISWNNKWYLPAGYRGDVKSLNLPDDLHKLKEK